MKTKSKFVLIVVSFLIIFLAHNVTISSQNIYNDTYSSYESVENNFLNEQFSTQYFSKLINHGKNSHGTCSYIAMIMILSFYNTYWDDNIIDETFEQNVRNVVSINGVDRSPGIRTEDESLASRDDFEQYIQNVRNNYANYFHFNLVKLGIDYFDFYNGKLFEDRYYSSSSLDKPLDSLGINYYQHCDLLEYYLYDFKSYLSSEVKIMSSRGNHDINKQFIINNILKGHPVVFFARSSDGEQGHVMVAYDYDIANDEIICNLGWGGNSFKAKYSSTAFSNITSAYVLHFHNQHTCSDNYEKISGSTICPCSLNMPLQYVNQYIIIDNFNHLKTCECGYSVEEEHQYLSNYLNNTYHRQLCNCNFYKDLPHAVENVSNGIGKCVLCNATINLNIGGGFIGGLMRNSSQVNFSESLILSNGIIVLSDNDVELYKQGLLIFDSNGNIEYKN